MFNFLGGLLGAGLNFFSKNEDRKAQEAANAQNLAFQREYAEKNIQLQRDFAQQGIRWKVDDAKAAGLHPLAALGSQVSSFSPISVGSDVIKPLPSAMSDMGQDLSRAISAASTSGEKADATTQKIQALQIERGELENSLLKTQLMKANQPAARQPSMPSEGKASKTGQPALDAIDPVSASGFPVTQDKMEQKPETHPATKRINPLGIPLHTWKGAADAEDLETRYSDVGEKLGLGNIPLDIAYTVWQNYIRHYWPTTFQDRFPEPARRMTPAQLKGRR